jgi:hypothetical protein
MFSRFFKKSSSTQEDGQSQDKQDSNQNANAAGSQAFPQLTAEKLKAVIVSLNQADPIFRKAGYLMEQMDVEFGIMPKLTPRFRQLSSVSDEEQAILIEEVKELQLIKFILISLNKSSRMQTLFEDSELYYYGMDIVISNEPSVRTVFKRKDSSASVVSIAP